MDLSILAEDSTAVSRAPSSASATNELELKRPAAVHRSEFVQRVLKMDRASKCASNRKDELLEEVKQTYVFVGSILGKTWRALFAHADSCSWLFASV